MPEKTTIARARKDARTGKAASTQAGQFVREEMEHIRRGKHGARSTKQAVAIGLSKARRSGVKLPPPAPGRASAKTRRGAERAYRKGQQARRAGAGRKQPSRTRSAATSRALRREPKRAASRKALSQQARSAARGRQRRR